MGAPRTGTCVPWASVSDVCSPCDDYSFPTGLLQDMLQVASDVLFHLSGRQFPGLCTTTVRPCARITGNDQVPVRWYDPWTFQWQNWQQSWGFCSCNRTVRTGCQGLSELTLGVYPLVAVQQVRVDGAILDPARYRIDDYRYLVRLPDADGAQRGWPCCQRMDLPATEVGTWEVQCSYGTAPPLGGKKAAASLGCQLAIGCQPESIGKCRLPQRVTQITRQGVTAVVLDPLTLFTEGRTGLPEVDLWLASVNPARLRRRATVTSPDIGRRVRRAGT